MQSFDTLGLNPELLSAVRDMGFTEPTPIQQQAIPPALAGRDVMACAMTGSGKTAAFVLPILNRLMAGPRGKTRALILSPTRELAGQIHEHMEALSKHVPLTGAAIYGGVGMRPQEEALRRGVDVVVATPGRLLDHMQYPYTSFAGLEVLVLDEADRMLDMGFLPDIRRILRQLPTKRQTLFFSATMPEPILRLSKEMLNDVAAVNLARKAAPATGISQVVYPVSENLKASLLVELLKRGEVRNAIVFCRTKHRANRLAEVLEKHKVSSARIHGNRSQAARTEALGGFKTGRYRVLVATDIVARGIDVEMLEHVVNFDVPNQPEDYVHRVGRTGRAQATGDALTLVAPDEEQSIRAIERAVGSKINRVQLEGFDYTARPAERFEVPIGERIAEIRRRKAEDRERGRQKAERKSQREAEEAGRPRPRSTSLPDPKRGSGGKSGSGGPPPALAGGSQRGRRGGGRGSA